MDNNVILEYINFIKKEFLRFYKIILDEQYDKTLIESLLERYILVRYYNETNYTAEKGFIERLSKELQSVVNPRITQENNEQIKSSYSLFGYISYFDDCFPVESYEILLQCFFKDKNIKINFTDEMKKEITKFIRELNKKKDRFYNVFDSNQLFLEEKRIKSNIYKLTLGHNVRVSNLYSDYAVSKAFNTGVVNEDKLFVMFLMTSQLMLKNATGLDFSRYYVIDFATSFFSKGKKVERIFNVIDNNLAKKHLILNIKYADYLLYKEKIDEFIKRGYSFSLTVDHTFDEDYANFVLFTCVFLDFDNEHYDLIIENRDQFVANLIII